MPPALDVRARRPVSPLLCNQVLMEKQRASTSKAKKQTVLKQTTIIKTYEHDLSQVDSENL